MRCVVAVVATYMIPDDLSSRRLRSRNYVMDGDPSAGVLLDTAVANGQLASEYIDTTLLRIEQQFTARLGYVLDSVSSGTIRGQKRELSTDCTGQYMYGCV